MRKQFEESEVPYSTLERFGLTQEMVEDLPVDVLQEIYDGRPSPILPVLIHTQENEAIYGRTRFALVRLENGETDIVFYPLLSETSFYSLPEGMKVKLASNKVQVFPMRGPDGKASETSLCYAQLDPETQQVLSVPTPVIARNIQTLAGNCNMSAADLQALQSGEVITIEDEGETLSIGLDLNSRTGIRIASGDEETWRKEGKRDWSKFNFGVYGCWVMDEDGDLDYISDEDYTEEMWNEQKKQGMRQTHSRTL